MIDGAVNLYLATAGILAAGLEGIQQQLDPGQRIDENLFARGDEFTNLQTLPHNLYEAMAALKQDALLMEMMGELGAKTFLEMKAKEWNAFNAQITTWEMDQYVNI